VRSMLALATPIALAAIVLTLGTRMPTRPTLDSLIVVAQVAALAFLVWAVLEQPSNGLLVPSGYFDPYLLSAPNLIAGVLIGGALTLAAIRPFRLRPPDVAVRAWRRVGGWGWAPLAIATLVTAVWLLPAVVTDSTLSRAGTLAAGHVPVQGEDYFSVVNGRTPLVNYISQYANLLPLVVAPVLRLFGASITSYSIAMCVFSGLGMLAVFGAFAQVTRGVWKALLLYVPWVALSLFPWNDAGVYREFNGVYYAVFPGRYLGPFVLVWLSAMWMRGRRIPIWALFGFAGLVVLNNYEFGIAALLALIAAAGFAWDRAIPLRRRLGDLLLQGAAGLVGALILVSVITLIRTGELPDLSLLTYFNQLFLRDSYGLEPMSTLGLHWALYLTYVAAILIAAVRYVRNEPDRTLTGMLVFSGVFGLVTGMYFVGRSAQFQLMLLFPAWSFALALLAWTLGPALYSARNDRARLRRILLPGLAALVGFGVMVSALDRLPQPQHQVTRLRAGGTKQDLGPVERLIESRTQPGEPVLIIGTGPDHLVAIDAGVENVSPLNGATSLISPKEANRSIDELEDEGGDLVFDALSSLPVGGFVFGVPEFGSILQQRGYRIVGFDPDLHLRIWRRTAS
jgi:hypothetical protein